MFNTSALIFDKFSNKLLMSETISVILFADELSNPNGTIRRTLIKIDSY